MNKSKLVMIIILSLFMLKSVRVEAKLESPQNPVAICKNNHSIELKWEKSRGADGYKVFRYDRLKKRYIKVNTIKKNISGWTDKSLRKHKVYYYKISSYKKRNSNIINSKKTYKICARTYGKKAKVVNAQSIYAELNTGKDMGICSEGKINALVLGDTNTRRNRTKVLSKKIIWSSSNEKIATVSKKGVIKTFAKEGKCCIKMRLHNGIVKTLRFKVVNYAKPKRFKYYKGDISAINNLLKNYKKDLCDIATFFTIYGEKEKKGKISADNEGNIIYTSEINNIKQIEDSIKRLMDNYSLPMDISYVGKGYVEFKIFFDHSYYIITYSEENDFSTSPLRIANHWIGKTYVCTDEH